MDSINFPVVYVIFLLNVKFRGSLGFLSHIAVLWAANSYHGRYSLLWSCMYCAVLMVKEKS